MKKGAPDHEKKLDLERAFATPAIRMLPDREIESAKGARSRGATRA